MANEAGKRFRPRLDHLYPVILSVAVTGILALPFTVSTVPELPSVTPFQGGTYSGASLNALFFVAALAASATAMFLLVRRGKLGFLRQMVKVALVIVCFSVLVWYSSILLAISGNPLSEPLASAMVLAVALVAGLVLNFFVFGKGKTRQLTGVVLVSGFTGVFLGASIDPLTALILAGALVVYDVIAVFRGPVGALAKTLDLGDLPGAVFNYKELSIGMGDMVFYSLVVTTALLNFGPLPFVATGLGVILGTFLGFRALQKFEMFPGLPFSLALGVTGMLLTAWLQGL